MVPMLVDGFTQAVYDRESTNPLRLTTGLAFGFGFVLAVAAL